MSRSVAFWGVLPCQPAMSRSAARRPIASITCFYINRSAHRRRQRIRATAKFRTESISTMVARCDGHRTIVVFRSCEPTRSSRRSRRISKRCVDSAKRDTERHRRPSSKSEPSSTGQALKVEATTRAHDRQGHTFVRGSGRATRHRASFALARMAKLVYARDLKSLGRKAMRVRPPLRAL